MRRFLLLSLVAGLLSICWEPSDVSSPFPPRQPSRGAKAMPDPPGLTFALQPGSVRFAVIGDSGTGDRHQYDIARQMVSVREQFPFDFVIMLGDNIYGGDKPRDYQDKFEDPYRPLLDAGVSFYASLGNHDKPSERFYKLFNMNGARYYTFKKGNARFFALDSNYMDRQQLDWIEQGLRNSNDRWKICFFHHPLYSDGKFHGPDVDLRAQLEPLFEKYGVNISFSGHDHLYERVKPQHGVYYFVLGNAGELRQHDLRRSSETEAGLDSDRAFLIGQIAGDSFYFQTITRLGETADHGIIQWQKPPPQAQVTEGQPRAQAFRGARPNGAWPVSGASYPSALERAP